MIKAVSFFGKNNEAFCRLNKRAEKYAAEKGICYEWVLQQPFDKEDVVCRLEKADAGIIDIEPYGEEIFSQIKESTKILVRFGVGYDKVDLSSASRNGIAIARTTGANTLGVAEMALTLILTLRRQIKRNERCIKSGRWSESPVCNELIGGTVGILGFGAIGRALAGLLRGMNCRIVAYDPFPNHEAAEKLGVELMDIDKVLEISDAISIHVPYMKETHHLISSEQLAKMKPSAVLVNTSRGNIVDEDALYEAMTNHLIHGAALDVFAKEPLPLDSKLLSLDNVILTPHVSSQTEESMWRIYRMALDIIADFFAGKEVKQILNPDYNDKRS